MDAASRLGLKMDRAEKVRPTRCRMATGLALGSHSCGALSSSRPFIVGREAARP
jgi:hypothetical protein